MKKIIILVFAMVIAISGCNSTDKDGSETIKIAEENLSVTFLKMAGETEIQFETNFKWQATSDADWLQVNPAEGPSGNNVLQLQVAEFVTEEFDATRSAKVTIQSKSGNTSIQIDVVQYAAEDMAPASLEFSKDAGSMKFVIYSPEEEPHVEWLGENNGQNPDAVPAWAELSESPLSVANGYYTYEVTVQANTTGEERLARVQPCFAGACRMIPVIQKGE